MSLSLEIVGGLVAFLLLVGGLLIRTKKSEGRSEGQLEMQREIAREERAEAQQTLDQVEQANEVRDRLDSDPEFANRVRDRFTRD